MIVRHVVMLCALAAASVFQFGCADATGGRSEITGKVTLEGKPLKEGDITFLPLEKQDTQSGAGIKNGEYLVPRANGLKPGKYRVQITAGDGKTPANEEAGGPGGSTNIVSVDLIPAEWNTDSDQTVVVKPGSANKFDFTIPKANTVKGKR